MQMARIVFHGPRTSQDVTSVLTLKAALLGEAEDDLCIPRQRVQRSLEATVEEARCDVR
jgi:hypothetical protein